MNTPFQPILSILSHLSLNPFVKQKDCTRRVEKYIYKLLIAYTLIKYFFYLIKTMQFSISLSI